MASRTADRAGLAGWQTDDTISRELTNQVFTNCLNLPQFASLAEQIHPAIVDSFRWSPQIPGLHHVEKIAVGTLCFQLIAPLAK